MMEFLGDVMANIVVLQSSSDARLAMSTAVAKKLVAKGSSITILNANNPKDFDGLEGVTTTNKPSVIADADVVISTTVSADNAILKHLKEGTLLIAQDSAISDEKSLEKIKACGIKFLALNRIPRITRAQSMDVLSSQSNIAGYRAVIECLFEYGHVCPMMMTAAGTIKPAKFLIIGAGVAGLQAIATAKRMGAIVSAFDVRSAAKEQVESLGATFIEVSNDEDAETKGGYAKEMSDEYKKRQAAKLADAVADSDIIITTAQIPNKPAPRLVSDKMIKTMRRGSVILDMAVETGGNCEGSILNEVTEKHGVKIIGYANLPGRVADDSSELFAKNIQNLLAIVMKDGEVRLDMEDEIIKSSLIVC